MYYAVMAVRVLVPVLNVLSLILLLRGLETPSPLVASVKRQFVQTVDGNSTVS
jgi:hypothetical protein